ncbi:hypothetical protein ACFFF7_00145 [Novosphingobium aquiterrae]|uniref:Uncharacterized protein n=1 Tax=Novosphingobium aquiterrae TaxID=624388 RepID=A0ABV6PDA3_9SPHN
MLRYSLVVPVLTAALIAQPATGRDRQAVQTDAQRQVDAVDVIATPASDLNLRKDEIPAVLVAAQQAPYGKTGLRTCAQIGTAVTALDDALGDDFDMPPGDAEKISAGRIAQSAVGSLIPFRGIIREISGANAHERRLTLAVQAGLARRAFLKGYGEARGCPYPARVATQKDVARMVLAAKTRALAAADKAKSGKDKPADQPGFVSQPVVQKVD